MLPRSGAKLRKRKTTLSGSFFFLQRSPDPPESSPFVHNAEKANPIRKHKR